ncbi:unnamed protein product, partial [Dicrocoelium dendriticum]
MFLTTCLLLLAIAFSSCQQMRQHETATGDGYATIRISVGLLGDNLTDVWRGVYGSANEVMNIVETTCSK